MSCPTPTSSTVQHPSTSEVETVAVPPAGTNGQTTPVPSEPSGRSAEQQTEVALGLNDGDRRVVAVLIVVAMALMLVHWYRLTQYRPAPIEVVHPEGYVFQFDVNTATWVEWMQLDGVGETLSRRIVEDRQQNGPFTSIDDVQRVPGIGPKTLAAMRPHLTCGPQPRSRTHGDNASDPRTPE